MMESISEIVSGLALAVAVGLMGALVNRRRKHLKLVVRVLDQKDQHLVDFLNQLVSSGQLTPASPAA
jgi:hypothetical protein